MPSPTPKITLGQQPGAHFLDGNIGLLADQTAQERLVQIELRGAGTTLGPSRHRAGGLDCNGPADRRGDPNPEAGGSLAP